MINIVQIDDFNGDETLLLKVRSLMHFAAAAAADLTNELVGNPINLYKLLLSWIRLLKVLGHHRLSRGEERHLRGPHGIQRSFKNGMMMLLLLLLIGGFIRSILGRNVFLHWSLGKRRGGVVVWPVELPRSRVRHVQCIEMFGKVHSILPVLTIYLLEGRLLDDTCRRRCSSGVFASRGMQIIDAVFDVI